MSTLDKILEKFQLSFKKGEMPKSIWLSTFGRVHLAALFAELEFTRGAEIGVESGEYSWELLHQNDKLTLYSIDAWKSHRAYRDHTSQAKLETFYMNTKLKLEMFGERSIIVRDYSMEAVSRIADRSLDFVYIDANHKFVEVAKDIHHWAKKVKQGGIVAGHDFTKYKDLEVEIHPAMVVPAFCEAYQIKPFFVFGEDVDPVKSWFFVQSLP